MTHTPSCGHRASCRRTSASPPGLSTRMSSERLLWVCNTVYNGPAYPPKSARTVLCAATHGLPAALRTSQGPPAE